MKRIAIYCVVLLCPAVLRAQALKSEDYTDTRSAEMRFEASVSKHFKEQHLTLSLRERLFTRLSEETTDESTGYTYSVPPSLRRSYTTLTLDYHPIEWVRIGGAYTLKWSTDKMQTTDATGAVVPADVSEYLRHRVSVYAIGQYTVGDWKFSLRERLDAHVRTDSVNLHEKPQTDLRLRHRVQAVYSIPGQPLKVYANSELIHSLNRPVNYLNTYAGISSSGGSTQYSGIEKPFGQYLTEARAQAGLRWRIDKHNALDLSYRFVYGYERDVNITKKQGYIELTHAREYLHVVALAYSFDW